MTCKNCSCNYCVQTRLRAAQAAARKDAASKRKHEREAIKIAKRSITIREKYFKDKIFYRGFMSILILSNDQAVRNMSVRAANICGQNGIRTLRDILEMSEWRLLRLRNMGPTTLKEFLSILEKGIEHAESETLPAR